MFMRLLGVAVLLGAGIRLAYLSTDDRWLIGGDGFVYHDDALRLADGLGYTTMFATTVSMPAASHPPGWVTLLGFVSWLGGRSLLAHQLTGMTIGLGVVMLVGLVGRRYFDARVGAIAAVMAALYPGFWVIEAQVLSEPLGLLLVGLLTLAIAELRDHPTFGRSTVVGGLCGAIALVRSEQLGLLAIVALPVIVRLPGLRPPQRAAWVAGAVLACGAVIAPWTIHNATRFREPVLLSTNGGATVLRGNCPPATYGGELLGYFDGLCEMGFAVSEELRGLDASQRASISMRAALHNMAGSLHRMPIVMAARVGRMLALFRPSQTVALTAKWMMMARRWPVWAWVASYWVLGVLAIVGAWRAHRADAPLLPLVGPLLIAGAVTAVAFGDPRYHAIADLGVIVLAALGSEKLWRSSGPTNATRPLSSPRHGRRELSTAA